MLIKENKWLNAVGEVHRKYEAPYKSSAQIILKMSIENLCRPLAVTSTFPPPALIIE